LANAYFELSSYDPQLCGGDYFMTMRVDYNCVGVSAIGIDADIKGRHGLSCKVISVLSR
jgi:hypothetical protein